MEYLSVFSLNAGKYGPEKTPYLGAIHAVSEVVISDHLKFVITVCQKHILQALCREKSLCLLNMKVNQLIDFTDTVSTPKTIR